MITKLTLVLYSIPVLVSLIIFQNHYSRDTVGALEKQLESDLNITPVLYASLNLVFFIPNAIAPLFTGFLTEYFNGPARFLMFIVFLASAGHILFAFGAQISNIPLIFIGRFIAGSIYEMMDCIPIIFLGPLFKEEWGMVCGLTNGFLRLGSVFCFLMNPFFYSKYGLRTALWASAALAVLSVLNAVAALLNYRLYHAMTGTSEGSVRLDKTVGDGGDVVSTEYNAILKLDVRRGDDDKDVELGDGDSDSTTLTACSSTSSIGSIGSTADSGTISRTSDLIVPTHSRSGDGQSSHINTPKDNDNDSDNSSGVCDAFRRCISVALKYQPLHEYGVQYHYFNTASCFLYGAMVPFWFLGSKFIQHNYDLTVGRADALMLLPEGVMVVISPVAGYLMDRYKPSLRAKLAVFSLSCAGLAGSYLLLAYGYRTSHTVLDTWSDDPLSGDLNQPQAVATHSVVISPLVSMTALGVSYALSNSILWTAIIQVIAPQHLASASGLLASCMNILPSVVPHIILGFEGLVPGGTAVEGSSSNVGLYVLTVCALLAALFAYLSSVAVNVSDDVGHSPTDSSDSDGLNSNNDVHKAAAFGVGVDGDDNDDDDGDHDSSVEMTPIDMSARISNGVVGGGGRTKRSSEGGRKYVSLGTGDYDE